MVQQLLLIARSMGTMAIDGTKYYRRMKQHTDGWHFAQEQVTIDILVELVQDAVFAAKPLGSFAVAQRLPDEDVPSATVAAVVVPVPTIVPSATVGASVAAANVASATVGPVPLVPVPLEFRHYPTPPLPTRSVELGTLPTGVANPEPQPFSAGYLAVAKSPVITLTASNWPSTTELRGRAPTTPKRGIRAPRGSPPTRAPPRTPFLSLLHP